jgi:hypothetical protein
LAAICASLAAPLATGDQRPLTVLGSRCLSSHYENDRILMTYDTKSDSGDDARKFLKRFEAYPIVKTKMRLN